MKEQTEPMESFGEDLGIPVPSGKPHIYLPGGCTQIRDTAARLYSLVAARNEVFYRGGTVVKAVNHGGGGLPSLAVLKPAAARSEFEKYAQFFQRRKEGAAEAVMGEEIAQAILATDVAQEILPNITGLINCPLLILDKGELHLLQPGYNSRTGLYVTGKPVIEPETLEAAVATVKRVICDFSFQSEGDVSRAVAAILTPALKFGGFITGTLPIEIIEASASQSGKGYFLLRRAAVYGEIPTTISQQKGGVGSFDEKLGSALVRGRPFITLDNLRGILDSQYVESYMTSPAAFSVRVPNSGESYIDPANYSLSITSNGLLTTEDLANRASFIRLTKENKGEFLEVDGKMLLEIIRENQPEFLGAVCKVIRTWFEAGMPKTAEKRHSFSSWSRSLDWIVQNIFKMVPLLDGNADAQQRIQSPQLTFVRLIANEIQKQERLNEPFSASAILELAEDNNINVPGMHPTKTYEPTFGRLAIGRVMRKVFDGSQKTFELESYRITRTEEQHKTENGNSEMIKFYQFTRTDNTGPQPTAEANEVESDLLQV